MKFHVVILAAAAVVAAAPGAAHTLLWSDLAAGMAPAEVDRLHPSRTAMVTPDCAASLKPVYARGHLIEVVLHLQGGRRCSEQVLALNDARYGKSDRRTLAFSGSMTMLNSHVHAWRANAVVVRLSINTLSGAGVLSYRLA